MKDILLKIVGSQISAGDEATPDGMEFITEGRFFRKGDSLYLSYEESAFSGMEGCTTTLKITGDKVRMRRFGEDVGVETAIEFEKGKRFNGLYETPFGAVEMEVLTNEIRNGIGPDGDGSLDIDYHVSLRGLAESRSMLSIEIMRN
jgi:uncharacterized beta-barrel protein YwiB (DUF1934 family)